MVDVLPPLPGELKAQVFRSQAQALYKENGGGRDVLARASQGVARALSLLDGARH